MNSQFNCPPQELLPDDIESLKISIRSLEAGRTYWEQVRHEVSRDMADYCRQTELDSRDHSKIDTLKTLAVAVPLGAGLWLGAAVLKVVEGALRVTNSNWEDEA